MSATPDAVPYARVTNDDAHVILNGRKVSSKQANKPFFVHAKHKMQQEAKQQADKAKATEEEQYELNGRAHSLSLDLLWLGVMGLLMTVVLSRSMTGQWMFGVGQSSSVKPGSTGLFPTGLPTRFVPPKLLEYLKGPAAAAAAVTNAAPVIETPNKENAKGDLVLTPEELRKYDGSDPTIPIYLAVNGEVFDVSANRATYGPGGSYHAFAGVDGARAYATGCFQTHLTPDLRGLDEAGLKSVNHWSNFYAKHKKYFKVGTVKHPPIDPDSPIPAECRPPPS